MTATSAVCAEIREGSETPETGMIHEEIITKKG